MKTISIFILLIYWSIMILAPVMSKDIKLSRAKMNENRINLKGNKIILGATQTIVNLLESSPPFFKSLNSIQSKGPISLFAKIFKVCSKSLFV